MYEQFYGLRAKAFQLKPDPAFFFGSAGHKRAMAYLEYGISQDEGFIVITGEVGAGKTTLVRNLVQGMDAEKLAIAHLNNTSLDPAEIVRAVVAAFGLPHEDSSKTILLGRLEQFLRQCEARDTKALLIVDEAQNLTPAALEELRMLSNIQGSRRAFLQSFLLGQPEFRRILMAPNMQQLVQRVIAGYHLGPLSADESRQYIEHRLRTVGWKGDPRFEQDAFPAIHDFTGGIPRRINTLCERLLLMGFLEELHTFGRREVELVTQDIQQEFSFAGNSEDVAVAEGAYAQSQNTSMEQSSIQAMDQRLTGMERSMTTILDSVKRLLSSGSAKKGT
jgi:general secretion pathway protein A